MVKGSLDRCTLKSSVGSSIDGNANHRKTASCRGDLRCSKMYSQRNIGASCHAMAGIAIYMQYCGYRPQLVAVYKLTLILMICKVVNAVDMASSTHQS